MGLVALSAVLHVAWNVRLKTAGDPLRAATVGMLAASVAIVPVGIGTWLVAGRPTLPGEGSRSGSFREWSRRATSSCWPPPIAGVTCPSSIPSREGPRHSSPCSSASSCSESGWALPGRRASACLSPGPLRRGGSGFDPAAAFAFATGATIATYTLIDRLGTRLIEPLTYAAILWVTTSVVLVGWVRFVAGGRVLSAGRAETRSAALGGFLTLGAYVLILTALSVAPLSGVAPLRESATVVAAVWGSVRLGEAVDRRETGRRVGASLLIVAGALLLAVTA